MKRILWISLTTAMCMAACGEKTGMQLKARVLNDTQKKGTETADPSNKTEGIFSSPDNADRRKIPVNGKSARNIEVGGDELQTTIFCTDNLTKAMGETERIKIQGGGQMMIRQVMKFPSPDFSENKNPKDIAKNPRPLVHIICFGASKDFKKPEPENKNISIAILETGKSIPAVGKFSNIGDTPSKVVIGCINEKTMGEGDILLIPSDANKNTTAADILLLENTKIIFETEGKDKDIKKYLIVVCHKATDNTLAEAESGD